MCHFGTPTAYVNLATSRFSCFPRLEINAVLSHNKLAGSAPRKFSLARHLETMQKPDPYSADNGGPQNPARQKLVTLRLALLRLHKTLLDMERRESSPTNHPTRPRHKVERQVRRFRSVANTAGLVPSSF